MPNRDPAAKYRIVSKRRWFPQDQEPSERGACHRTPDEPKNKSKEAKEAVSAIRCILPPTRYNTSAIPGNSKDKDKVPQPVLSEEKDMAVARVAPPTRLNTAIPCRTLPEAKEKPKDKGVQSVLREEKDKAVARVAPPTRFDTAEARDKTKDNVVQQTQREDRTKKPEKKDEKAAPPKPLNTGTVRRASEQKEAKAKKKAAPPRQLDTCRSQPEAKDKVVQAKKPEKKDEKAAPTKPLNTGTVRRASEQKEAKAKKKAAPPRRLDTCRSQPEAKDKVVQAKKPEKKDVKSAARVAPPKPLNSATVGRASAPDAKAEAKQPPEKKDDQQAQKAPKPKSKYTNVYVRGLLYKDPDNKHLTHAGAGVYFRKGDKRNCSMDTVNELRDKPIPSVASAYAALLAINVAKYHGVEYLDIHTSCKKLMNCSIRLAAKFKPDALNRCKDASEMAVVMVVAAGSELVSLHWTLIEKDAEPKRYVYATRLAEKAALEHIEVGA
ncbi:neurofilament heavy polypeptide-like [Cloeon dipterum]|uniref:neurofilament heavy polypeptide-like n=1 Tax=Cloeon dipterum TaxID=197152 RepID=UPI00321FF573